jgi:hypothetical protein
MRFPYQSYPVRGAGTTRSVLVHRPVFSVHVIGPKGDADLMAEGGESASAIKPWRTHR